MKLAACVLVGLAFVLLLSMESDTAHAGEVGSGTGLLDIHVTFKSDGGADRPLGDVRVDLRCANLPAKSLHQRTDASGHVSFEAPFGKCQLYADSPAVVDGRSSFWQREVELTPEKATVDFSSENDVLLPVPPRAIKEPVYPKSARKDRIEGKVILQAAIGVDGLVTDVDVLASSNAVFNDSAIDFIKKRKYKPALLNGQPVAVHLTIRVDFRLGSVPVP